MCLLFFIIFHFNYGRCFLFYLKSSFRSRDIFVMTFRSYRKIVLIRKITSSLVVTSSRPLLSLITVIWNWVWKKKQLIFKRFLIILFQNILFLKNLLKRGLGLGLGAIFCMIFPWKCFLFNMGKVSMSFLFSFSRY